MFCSGVVFEFESAAVDNGKLRMRADLRQNTCAAHGRDVTCAGDAHEKMPMVEN